MKKILICLFSVFFVLLLVGCGKQEPVRTSKLEVGKTYDALGSLTVIDEKRFVRLVSTAEFDTEEELEEEAEGGLYYPYIDFYEGYYEKHGKDYHFIRTRDVRVTFKNVANIKKKIVSKIELEENSNPEKKYMIDAVAVLIITTCIIPLLVIFFFLWLMKLLFNLEISARLPKLGLVKKARGLKKS